MAPPISRRSKQNSPTSPPPPIPLPGIALGLFAAIAAGFAASRALRRKRPAQSLQDEQPIPHNLVQEREIEIKEKDDSFNVSAILVNAHGTITIAHEPSKLAGGLKPVFDAFEESSFAQKRDAKPLEEGRGKVEEEKGEEEDYRKGQREEAEKESEFEENEKKKGEAMENGETSAGEEGEIADITVNIEASLVVADEASVEAEEEEEEEEEEEKEETTEAEGKGEEVEDDGVIDDEDTGHDGDDDRSSADQQQSPVLINGRALDFSREIPDFKDDPGILSSGSNSLSDAVSVSSMQEVSSEPVRPFVSTDEALEAVWPGAKPEFFVALNQSGQENAFSEDKNWSDKKRAEFVENTSQTDQNFSELKNDWVISNDDTLHLKLSEHDVGVGMLNLKPVLVDIEEKESSVDKICQIKFEIFSDVMGTKGDSIGVEGEVPIKVNGRISESTTINGMVLSNGSPPPLPEELDDLESIDEGERINGHVLLDESLNVSSISKVMTADETSPPTGQERTDGTISDVHGEPDSLAAIELTDDNTCVSSKGELNDDESTQEVACLGIDSSEKLIVVEGILEEPVPQPAAQELGIVDGTSAENNVNLEQEQSSLFIESKGITEGNDLSFEGSTDNVDELSSGREDINDGLSEQIVVEGRIYVKEQEIEEITRSCDLNDLIFETKKLASLAKSAHDVSDDDTREVDYLVSKGATTHHHGLQPKGGFSSKVLQYLPLEISFICLLIALVSFALWYLEVSPLIRL